MTDSPRESLQWALQVRRRVPEAPEWLGTIKPITVLRRILEMFSAPIRSPLASIVQKFFDMGRTPSADGGGEELPVGGHRIGPVGANAKRAQAPAGMTFQLSSTPIGHRYPEWDFRAGAYRRDHCAVAEFDPPPNPGAAENSVSLIRDMKLRRQLALLGLSYERHRREPDGDGLPYEDAYENRYAQEDTRRALQEAVARGVGCVCLSVRSSTPDEVLESVWGEIPHRRLVDASALSDEVRPLFAEALKLAAASRRPTGNLSEPKAQHWRRSL